MIALGVMTALIAGGPIGPDRAPQAPQRFKMDFSMTQSVDLTPMGQGVMDSEVTGSAFVALTMSDTVGGKLAHLVVDSVVVKATGMLAMQFPAEAMATAQGQFFHAYIVDGKVKGAPNPSVEGSPAMGLAAPALSLLFVGLADGKKVGDVWADTIRSSPPADGPGMSNEMVSEWTVTAVDGGVISMTGTQQGTVSGEPQPGQQLTGTVTGTAEVTSLAGGPTKTGRMQTQQKMEVLVDQAPDVIRVEQTTSAELIPLP